MGLRPFSCSHFGGQCRLEACHRRVRLPREVVHHEEDEPQDHLLDAGDHRSDDGLGREPELGAETHSRLAGLQVEALRKAVALRRQHFELDAREIVGVRPSSPLAGYALLQLLD
jgi:hypothetical protein